MWGVPSWCPKAYSPPSPISALVNRALDLYLQWLHICERVSFLTVAHHKHSVCKESVHTEISVILERLSNRT